MNNIIFYTLPIKIFMLKIKFNIILSCLPAKTMPRDALLQLKKITDNVMPFCKKDWMRIFSMELRPASKIATSSQLLDLSGTFLRISSFVIITSQLGTAEHH